MNMESLVRESLQDVASSLADMSARFVEPVGKCVEETAATLKNGGTIFFCGNGGSTSAASHIANDLSCHTRNWNREGYRCICLNDSTAVLTSLTNDYGFECVYSRPLETLGKPGDILWAYSTSGNSGNVVRAVEAARKKGIKTVAFTGRGGGKLKDMCDIWVGVNNDDVTRVEELHLIYSHGIALGVKAAVSPMQ